MKLLRHHKNGRTVKPVVTRLAVLF